MIKKYIAGMIIGSNLLMAQPIDNAIISQSKNLFVCLNKHLTASDKKNLKQYSLAILVQADKDLISMYSNAKVDYKNISFKAGKSLSNLFVKCGKQTQILLKTINSQKDEDKKIEGIKIFSQIISIFSKKLFYAQKDKSPQYLMPLLKNFEKGLQENPKYISLMKQIEKKDKK
jgi:hypothetical protein